MLPNVSKKEQAIRITVQPDKNTPVVSLFMPFEPKMVSKNELAYKLQLLMKDAEQKLIKNFPIATAEPVLKRLKATIKNLEYSTHKKSVAIYVSAKGEKVFYLDVPLEEKVLVASAFNIRSLIENQQSLQHYIVLVLRNNFSKVYFGDGAQLVSMLSNNNRMSQNDAASSENFLRATDNNLNIILNYFPSLPLFVMGDADILNKYSGITKNKTHITQLIKFGSNDMSVNEVKTALQPYITNWEYVQAKHLHQRMGNALECNRAAIGINNVIKIANQRRAKLLVLEKDYKFPVVKAESKEPPLFDNAPFADAVNEIIERVLSTGGDVMYADKEVLRNYKQIALIY